MNLFLTTFLLLLPYVAALSFNFTSFTAGDNRISFEGAAAVYDVSHAIKLTTSSDTISRATYADPLRLWDKSSGDLTSFTTNFSFVIYSQNRSNYGDGLAFFLAPAGSRIPAGVTRAGRFGLTTDDEAFNSTDHPFVAVEFDIYQNDYDPNGTHVGIDVMSIRSVNNISWWSSVKDGKTNEAWIRYDSGSKNLSVVFTGFTNNSRVLQGLSYVVDLREYLPEWVTFGFAATTGSSYAVQVVESWSFSSTLLNPKKFPVGLAVWLGVGAGVACGLGFILFVILLRNRKRRHKDGHEIDIGMEEELERGTGPRKFKYNVLARATTNFSEENKLGEGGFGGVYKGFLKELNTRVAVKRISRGSKQGTTEYASEVKIISSLRHRNLVQLMGWCHEKRELLLVYEFMPNGSLDSHLYRDKLLLPWATRYKIVQGLASALLYLHEEWELCVVHRDIKTSNVLLDLNFNAKLGDFGLARLVDHEKGSQTTNLAGTMGYMAPESCITGKASKETDIFSFGVVALEIACGRKPINHKLPENQINLVEWVWGLYGMTKLLEASDPKLGSEFVEQEMERLMVVGLWCAHPDNKLRPSMKQVIQVLEFEAALPVLPSEMPVATFMDPFMARSTCASESNNSHNSHSSILSGSPLAPSSSSSRTLL
ncbi:unnamed protein product [Thlaspi arvense]|uniref:Protein kinase domain-containing protein n=1 Tax=Thlaspi arvense TaxID=13288 RepID=A0AAU9RM81_THLAR|nr:unnamed protein product [Thlaspi arvense]